MGKFNDIDELNWKEIINDITTSSMWLTPNHHQNKYFIPNRNILPPNDPDFHGLFIPEIPYQFIKRFTKKNEVVWDCFGGSGTTFKVAQLLDRECIINDLNPKKSFITKGDSKNFEPYKKVQLLFMHPPYHDIIKYSNHKDCGSNCKDIDNFLSWFEEIVSNCVKYLDSNRFLILVCGNIYKNGEEQTLGVWCKDIIRKYGFKCKAHIVKDYGETKGGNKNYNLNYYRQLKGNYNSFYGDNIFILQKFN